MDTSETYIKMCEKAAEIQALKPKKDEYNYNEWSDFSVGSVFWDERVVVIGTINQLEGICDDCVRHTSKNLIWLPRQDQLQEMLNIKLESMLGDFYNAIGVLWEAGWTLREEYEQFTSMEQLWLAFVMKEKYNKIWDGESWVVNK